MDCSIVHEIMAGLAIVVSMVVGGFVILKALGINQ